LAGAGERGAGAASFAKGEKARGAVLRWPGPMRKEGKGAKRGKEEKAETAGHTKKGGAGQVRSAVGKKSGGGEKGGGLLLGPRKEGVAGGPKQTVRERGPGRHMGVGGGGGGGGASFFSLQGRKQREGDVPNVCARLESLAQEITGVRIVR